MQKEKIEQFISAIALRHSVRTFTAQPVPDDLKNELTQFIDTLEVPFEHNTRLQMFTAEPGKKLYNNGVNPPDNFAVLAQTDLVSIAKMGFAGEIAMLYAVSLGLSTCWFGHYKLSEVGRYVEGISSPDKIKESTMGYGYGKQVDVGERVICCMPIGYKDENKKRLVDIVAGKNGANRKPLEKLLEKPEIVSEIPKDTTDVLELAKLAPSAANSQMWRFGFDNGFKTITVAKPVGYKHFKWEHPDVDVGMCAAHIWLGLLSKGFEPKVEVKPDADRALWSFVY